ncbi:MAG: hypothetical protein KG028_06010, partial [Actinobacteria bacterium]|nr:hypothetical protein [Actinomycetota bacterium]
MGPRVALAFATAAALVLAMLVPTTAAALEDGRRAAFAEGFETGTDTWVSGGDYGTITRVTSGTGAVVSASGAAHAVVRESQPGSGPYSRLGGYRDTWVGTWGTSLSIHLDPAWASGAGFDYSVAASDSDGLHRRDFIFHVTSDEGVLHIDASNNSDTGGAPKPVASMSDASRTVEDAGWYRFDHVFRDQDGKLAVDLVVTPVAGGDAVFSTTRTTELDDIAAVGGNRYAWFTLIEVIDGLAIDDHVRWVTEGGLDAVNGAATTTTMMELIRTHREVLGLDAASLARHDALPLGQGRQQAVAAALVGAKLLVGGSYTTLAQVREVFDFAAAEEHTKFELINAIDQATAVAEIAEGLSTHAGPLAAMRRHSVQTFRDAGLTAQANELESNNYARMVFRLADASPSLVTTVAEGLLAARGSGKFLGVVQIADAAMALPVMQPVQVLRGGDVVAGHGSIQSAVSAAVAGDAITVAAGTYLENVRVDHVDGVTIRAATDERPRIVGVDGNSRRRVVDIGASDVAFLGFEISGPSNYVGIAIPGTNATIVGNVISDVVTGIQTNTPSDREGGNTITGNVIDGTSVGISLQNRGSTVTDNDVVGATLEAVASSASGNTITGNRFSVAGAGKLAVAYAGATLDVARNWWGSNARPSDALLSGDVVVSPWCTTSSCVAVTDGTPPPVIA